MEGCNARKIFDNHNEPEVRFYHHSEGSIDIKLPGKLRIYGDIMIVFKYYGSFAFTPLELFRVTFNTAFIGTDNLIEVDRWSISPELVQKEKTFSYDFSCRLFFSDYCRSTVKCRSDQTPLDKICKQCLSAMTDEVNNWYESTKILNERE